MLLFPKAKVTFKVDYVDAQYTTPPDIWGALFSAQDLRPWRTCLYFHLAAELLGEGHNTTDHPNSWKTM